MSQWKRQNGRGSSAHPYAAIEHRIIDSIAYRTLTFSAKSALTVLSRHNTKDNNGHIFVSVYHWAEQGFNPKTKSRVIKELIAHGLIWRTRSGGIGRGCACFALTWKKITNSTGVFVQGFKLDAWRDYQHPEKNTDGLNWLATQTKTVRYTPVTTRKCPVSIGQIYPS